MTRRIEIDDWAIHIHPYEGRWAVSACHLWPKFGAGTLVGIFDGEEEAFAAAQKFPGEASTKEWTNHWFKRLSDSRE